jgi:hypothetical protein
MNVPKTIMRLTCVAFLLTGSCLWAEDHTPFACHEVSTTAR